MMRWISTGVLRWNFTLVGSSSGDTLFFGWLVGFWLQCCTYSLKVNGRLLTLHHTIFCVDGGLSPATIRMVGGSFVPVCVWCWPIDVSRFGKWMTMGKRRWLVVSPLVYDWWWRSLIGSGFWLCSGVTPIRSLYLIYVLVKMWWFCDACFLVSEDFNMYCVHLIFWRVYRVAPLRLRIVV